MPNNARGPRPSSVKTETAAAFAAWLQSAPPGAPTEKIHRLVTAPRPRWVAATLWWAERPVKCVCREARNQVSVLEAFEAAGWPKCIDDPLPALTGRKGKKRRLQTIRSLNEGLEAGTIRFRADGTGRGICWEEAC